MLPALLACVLLFTGCENRDPEKTETVRVGVAIYQQNDTFISNVVQEMERLAREKEGESLLKINLSIADGQSNQTLQMEQVDRFLDWGCDVLCVNMVDRTAAAVIVDKAEEAGVPVIFFNRQPVEEDLQRWEKAYYVGPRGEQSGIFQGQIVWEQWQEDRERVDRNGDGVLQYVMLEGEPSHQDALLRTEYSIKTLTNAGVLVEKLASDTANWNRGQAAAKMSQWYQEFGSQIEAVFANNDDMALGAIDVLLEAGVAPEEMPVIVGVDATAPALEAMAAEKPVVLSGAQGHTGLFRPELLEKAIDTNFCCRTDPIATEAVLLEAVTSALALPEEEKRALGRYGRQVVQEHYSVRRMAEDCLAVYDQVHRRRYHVVMSGYYGFSNAGDDAILQSIHEGILAASRDVAVTVLSNDPELTWDLCGLEAVPRFQVWKVLKSLWRCDALLSGGGSLLQDRTSTRSLLYYLSIIQAAELFHKPVMLYANGIGPVQKPSNRRRVRRAVERAALVTLRDGSSARELQEMGVTRPDLHVTADPVFNLPPASRERGMELLQAARLPQGSRFAVVSVRDWPGTEEFPQKLAGLCDHLRRTYGMEILFLLMQPKHDRNTTGLVRQAMEEPSYLLDTATTPRELMAVLGEAELCVAMRLHTLIFAARMAVPCIGLVYDPKVESYLQELDMPSAGHVERFDREEAIACADRMMADYEGNLVRLRQKSEALAKAALRNEELLLELLKQTKG